MLSTSVISALIIIILNQRSCNIPWINETSTIHNLLSTNRWSLCASVEVVDRPFQPVSTVVTSSTGWRVLNRNAIAIENRSVYSKFKSGFDPKTFALFAYLLYNYLIISIIFWQWNNLEYLKTKLESFGNKVAADIVSKTLKSRSVFEDYPYRTSRRGQL